MRGGAGGIFISIFSDKETGSELSNAQGHTAWAQNSGLCIPKCH